MTPTFIVRRVLPLVALASVLVLLVRIQRVPEIGSDAWMHLRMGDEFRSGWSLRDPGHLGEFDSARWYPTQWLSQVTLSWAAEVFGLGGVVWLAGALIVALPIGMYVVCRRSVAPLPAAIATVVGACAAAPGLSARPQIVSYLLVLVVTHAWMLTARDHRPRYWLILVAWVWVPIHGTWLVGVSIGLAVTAGMALARSPRAKDLVRLAFIPVASALVPMLSPLGLHAYSTVVGVGERTAQLSEWGPPDFTTPNAAALAVMIAIILVTMLRSGPVDWPTVMLFGLGIAWGLFSVRTTVVAAVILTPLLAIALQRLVPAMAPMGRRELAAVAGISAAALLALAFVAASRADESPAPAWLDARMDEMPSHSKVLNDWELGHWAMWRHPQLELVMHGYVDVFTLDELERNINIVSVGPDWDRDLHDMDVDYAVVDPGSPLGYSLVELLHWPVVQQDENYALLTPPAS